MGKKLLAAAFALLLVAGTFAGCNLTDGKDNNITIPTDK